MGIPDGNWNEILSIFLVAKHGVAYFGGWFEKAEHNMADVSSLLVEAPCHCLNNKMCKCNMWRIRVFGLEIKIILFDICLGLLNSKVLFQISGWIGWV